jgi:hypothetical protein
MTKAITLQSRQTPYPKGGVNRSEVQQQFADAVVEDLGTLAEASNENALTTEVTGNTILDEMTHVKTQIKALQVKNDFRERNAENLVYSLDFSNKKDFFYDEDSIPSNRLVLDQRNAQIYLPATSVQPLFFREDPSNGDIIPNQNLDARVVSISEGISGSYQPTVSAGNVKNAFDGFNSSYWIRSIEYPMEAPVTEVEMEIEIIVPEGSPSEFNVLALAPHPIGRCDITGVWYKERPESTWALLEEFPTVYSTEAAAYVPDPINESGNIQWQGQIRPVYAFKIGFRQRDWVIKNNKKVFVYGAQEIGARLTRFSNISTINPLSTKDNAHIIYKVTSPEDTNFGAITKIDIGPNAKSEGQNVEDNHVIYQISKVPNPSSSTDILWASHSFALPQNGTSVTLSNIKEYYVIISMKFVNEITKDLSVFKNGTSPVVEFVNIVHTLSQDTVTAGATSAFDWTGRNAGQHFQNIIMMDAYRGAIEDESNMFIFWDDMWEDGDWRSSLEDTFSNISFGGENMAMTVTSDLIYIPGSIQYTALTSAQWGAMLPRRLRLQAALSNTDNSTIEVRIAYELNNAPQDDIIITTVDLDTAKGSIDWIDIPKADPDAIDYVGDVTALSLIVNMANGDVPGARPKLYQFALIIKD